jgi:hypothetical protein
LASAPLATLAPPEARVLDLPPQKVNPAATVRDPAALGVVRIGDRIFAVCVLADES